MKGGKITTKTGNRLAIETFVLFAILVTSTIGLLGTIGALTPQQGTPNHDNDRGITWDARIDFSETNGSTDYVYIGEAPDANDGPPADSYDVAKPPEPMVPYIRAYLKDGMTGPFAYIWKDYRHYPATTTKTWNLYIKWEPENISNSTTLTISWSTTALGLSEYDKIALTYTNGTVIVPNMFITSSYTYTAPPETTKQFRIVGTVDTTKPHILNQSPATGETGDAYTFSASVTDDMTPTGSLLVKVNWQSGSLSGNDTMTNTGGTNFEKTITLSNYTTTPLTYHLYAKDSAKIPNSNYTSALTATITDDEYPQPLSDDTTGSPTTGEPMYFKLTVIDNIDVASVKANYRWKQSSTWGDWTTDEAMTEGGGNQWSTASISVPSSATDVQYYFKVSDGTSTVYICSGSLQVTPDENTAQTSPFTKTIQDNDNPGLTDNSPAVGTTGDSYIFDVTASDNIAVSTVKVTWSHTPNGGTNVALNNDGDGTWSLTVTLADSLSSMTYTITVTDTSSNIYTGSLQTVTVTDNDNPTIYADTSPTSGTTGDSYTFEIDARDNIAVSGVSVTWTHGTSGDTDLALDHISGTIWRKTVTLADSLSDMTYTITVTDTSSHTCVGGLTHVTVTDNDNPTIAADNSPSSGTTGDAYTFEIDARDNIGVSGVSVTWTHGSNGGTDALSHVSGTIWRKTVTLADSLSDMTYTITVTDTSSHTCVGGLMHVAVTDNDNPTIYADSSPSSGTTGDSYTFVIDARDNIAVSGVSVTWTHGTSGDTDLPLSFVSGTTWSTTISLANSLSDMTYTITVTDTSSRTCVGTLHHVTVTDNDNPVIYADTSPSSGTTGDAYTFEIDARDNIGVSGVSVTWSHGTHGDTNLALTYVSGTIWQKTVTLADSLSDMTYTITVTDTSSHTSIGGLTHVAVTDNDNPSIYADTSPTSGTTGDSYTFVIDARDNIAVTGVSVTWTHGTSGDTDLPLSFVSGTTWSTTISLANSLSDMTYTITVTDTSAHTCVGSLMHVAVTDNDNPVIYADTSPSSGTTGDAYTFEIDARDNIAVSGVSVTWTHGTHGDTNLALTYISGTIWRKTVTLADSLSDMTYTITVTDTSSHTCVGSLTHVTVTDNDNPTIFADTSPHSGTTGDAYTFEIDARDNIGVSGVSVVWVHGSNGGTDALSYVSGTIWRKTVTLADSLSDMTYTITVTDTSSRTCTGSLTHVAVTDNDPPLLSAIGATPTTQIVNGNVKISATVTDNINVNTVHASISGPAGFTPVDAVMTLETGNTYSYEQAYTIVGTYDYTVWAKDTSNNQATSANYQFNIYAELQITTTLAGWNFFSLPFNQTVTKANLFVKVGASRYTWAEAVTAGIVMNRMYDWLRTDQKYDDYDITSLVPGHGYWMYSFQGCEIWATGLNPFQDTPYITLLKVGWNIVGVPHDQAVNKADLIVTYSGTDYTWANAGDYVMKDIFGWQRTTPQQYLLSTTLSPGESYWIYAYTECTLRRPT